MVVHQVLVIGDSTSFVRGDWRLLLDLEDPSSFKALPLGWVVDHLGHQHQACLAFEVERRAIELVKLKHLAWRPNGLIGHYQSLIAQK